MLSRVKNSIIACAVVLSVTLFGRFAVKSLLAQSQDAPGIVPKTAKSLSNYQITSFGPAPRLTSSNGIVEFASFTGRVSLSVDAIGTNYAEGTVEVEKPAGATVRSAYLMAASNFTRVIGNGDVSIGPDAASLMPVTWDASVVRDLPSYPAFFNSVLANVTVLVQPVVDASAAGRVPFVVTEVGSGSIDGVILAVVFDDPNQTADHSIILLFGGQLTTGDVFNLELDRPIDLSDPASVADMGLGISFGYQDVSQYSVIDVSGVRLTTAAGGQDDGAGENGALITVGGLDDSHLNPPFPYATPVDYTSDDELYDLRPFLDANDVLITVNTVNPSNDDNIFFAWFATSSPAVMRETITLSPRADTSYVGAQHSVVARVRDSHGDPNVGQEVRFLVLSGPHAGMSGASQTDNNGEATFTYLGRSTGTDTIRAFSGDANQAEIESNLALATWIIDTHKICLSHVSGVPGDSVWVPITISTDSCIGLAQFVVEYDSTVLEFARAEVGAQLNGYSLLAQSDLPFDPTSASANENVLIQLSNGSACFTGDDVEAATVWFTIRAYSPAGQSPLEIDPDREHTFLTTENLTILSGDNLEFCSGYVEVASLSSICIPLPDNGRYGFLPFGDQQHPDRVVYCFQPLCGDVAIKYQVYDIDFDGEVEVYLNGAWYATVGSTPNNTWSTARLLILPDTLLEDYDLNYLVFDHSSSSSAQERWAVTVAGIEFPFDLPYSPARGLIPLGDQAHGDKVMYKFYGYYGDMHLVYQVYDIDDKFELSIYLNGKLIKRESPTVDAKWSATRVVLLKDGDIRHWDCNLIVFENNYNPAQQNPWGVRRVSLSENIPLPYTPAIGKIRNGDKDHVDAAGFSFNGQQGDYVLTYEAYDIDTATEVAVILNGVHLQYEAITADEQWSTMRTLLLPDAFVYDYGSNDLVFDNTKNPPREFNWGVRKLKVAPATSASAPIPELRTAKVLGNGISGERFLLDGNAEIPDRVQAGELAGSSTAIDQELTMIQPGGELTITLDTPQRLDRLVLYPEETPERFFNYRLEVSNDGKNWVVVVDKSEQWLQGLQFEALSGIQAHMLRLSGESYLVEDESMIEEEVVEMEESALEHLYRAKADQAKPGALAIRELVLYRAANAANAPQASTDLPTAFGLTQSYPNPFSLSRQGGMEHTLIRYEMPQAERVTITIFDALGRQVRTLVDAMRSAGSHEVLWDGRDDFGRPVAAGVYVYRMKAGSFATQRTMVLTK